MKFTTLRPGYLVSLKTSCAGNVSYRTRTIEEEQRTDDGGARAVWETERRVQDQAEQEEAIKVRSKARSLITSVCADSSFGLLCPEHKAQDLASAVEDARELAEDFNKTASVTNVSVYVIAGRVAADDVEAVRAINSEMRELMSAMEVGYPEPGHPGGADRGQQGQAAGRDALERGAGAHQGSYQRGPVMRPQDRQGRRSSLARGGQGDPARAGECQDRVFGHRRSGRGRRGGAPTARAIEMEPEDIGTDVPLPLPKVRQPRPMFEVE